MNLKKIIREELTGLEWIQDIIPSIPAEDLQPNDRFMIVTLEGKSYEEYISSSDLKNTNPFTTVFVMDDSDCFLTDDAENITDIWLQSEDDIGASKWVSVEGMWVTVL